MQLMLEVDENRFARLDVADHVETQRIECHGFGSHQIFRTGIGFVGTINQRTDAIGITESEQTVTGNQHDHSVGTATTPMHAADGLKNAVNIKFVAVRCRLQFMGKDVQQHFRIGVGIDVTAVSYTHLESGLVIGRAPGADVRVPDPEVSKLHAWVGISNQRLTARDLKSTNGTFLNDRLNQPITECELREGDILVLGRHNGAKFRITFAA